jgi:hypothetical protein
VANTYFLASIAYNIYLVTGIYQNARYNVSIAALAILTGSNKSFYPKPYVEEYLGMKL